MSAPARSRSSSALWEHARDPYLELDTDGRLRAWNPAAAASFGVAREDALGRPLRDVVPDLADLSATTTEAATLTVTVDGRAVAVRTSPRSDGVAALLSPADPGEVLLANTVHYQALFDAEGTVLAANDALLSMIDLAAADVVGVHVTALPVDADLAAAYGDVLNCVAQARTGRPASSEVHLDGECHEVLVHPVTDDEGTVEYLVFEGRNVDDLRTVEAERDRLFDVSRDLVCTLEFGTHLTQLNPRWQDLLGWAPDGLLGESLLDLVHPDDREHAAARLARVADSEAALRVDARLRSVDGDYRWFTWDCLAVADSEAIAVIARDVTNEKAHEAELERQRALFEQVQSMADIGAWELDLRTEALYWTSQVYDLHGVTPAEYTPTVETAIDFYHPEDRPVIERLVAEGIRDGTGWNDRLRIVTAAGEVRWVHAKGTVHHEDGAPTVVRGTFQNVTDEYEREARLRESEARLRESTDYLEQLYERSTGSLPLAEKVGALLDIGRERFGVDLAILARIEDGTYTVEAASAAGEAIPAGERFDLTDTYCEVTYGEQGVVDFHEARPDREQLHPCYESFGIESYIGAPVVVDGEPFGTVNFSSTTPRDRPFADADRVYVRLLAQWLSYELERAADEAALARREHQLRTIVDTVPYPIFLKDGDGVYRLANEAAAAVIGAPVAAVEGGSDEEFFGPDLAADIAAVDRRAIAGDLSPDPFIESVRLPNGETRTFQSRKLQTTDVSTDEPLVLGVAVDVTDLKAIEAALKASKEELEVRYTQLEFFDSLMRHDVLNALTVIRLTAEMLAETGPDEATREDGALIVEWSDDIVDLVSRLRGVVDALGGDDPAVTPVDVGAELAAELPRLRAAYPEATLTATVADDATALAGDMLGEVLGNVVRNALVHSDRPDPTVDVAVTREDDTVRVVVEDDGPGVPDDRKTSIFRRGETSHVKHSGSGFGLFFVDSTVTAYGGSVCVEDNDPRGARFTIELVAAQTQEISHDDS
jgi:PAS domain S-box-containing protein